MAHSIDRSALVFHSSERMYSIVNDVASYPAFLPWCSDALIVSQGEREMVAMLGISKGVVRQQFTTRNSFVEHNEIKMELVDGPFRYLKGVWQFKPLETTACKVMLTLDFDFDSQLAKAALASICNQAANTMVDAFCKRANEVYGS
jgi:ribosome-associated toxin RatA of RatAB toxin-antitoxin module